jgi:CRP-like cAMP-binding protein
MGGSFASDPIARSVGAEGLLVACALLLSGAALAGLRLRTVRPRRLERGVAVAASPVQRRGGRTGAQPSARRLWSGSRLFRLLLICLLCGGALNPVLYFQFAYAADAATLGANGEQALLTLYAQFRGWLSLALLVAQLWLSGRLFRRFGLPLSLALWPATYLVGFTWLGVRLTLPGGITSLGAARVTEDGIAEPARRVLFNLFPESLRARASGILEGPVYRLGGVLGNGLVLIALAAAGVQVIGYAALPAAAIWFAAALVLWRAYPGLLLQASADRSLAGLGADKEELLDARTVRALAPNLVDANPRACRAALDLVVDAEPALAAELLAEAVEGAPEATRPQLVDALHRLVEPHAPGALRAPQAASVLARALSGESQLLPEERADLVQVYARLTGGDAAAGELQEESNRLLERALGDREAAVRLAAIAELHRRGRPPPGVPDLDTALAEALAGRDVLIRRTARKELRAMLLSTEPGDHWERRLALLAGRLQERADRAGAAEALVEVARHHRAATRPCAESVLRRADDPDPRVRAAVLSFAGHARVSAAAPRLVAALGSRYSRESAAARGALVALGPEAVQPLLLEYEFGAPAHRDAAVSVLRELDVDAAAVESLYSRQLDAAREALVLRAALDSEGAAGPLLRRLEERLAEALGALLAFLAVLHDDERIAELERRLRRTRGERSRDILVEAIEALLSPEERGALLLLLESGAWEKRGRRAAEQLGRPFPSAESAWSELPNDRDALTRRLVAFLAARSLEPSPGIGDPSAMLDPMEIAVYLQGVHAFDRLSTQQLVGLAETLQEERYAAGEPIFAEGDEGDGLYFVLGGEVELTVGDVELERIGPGAFFGELSTLDGVPRSTSSRACQDTRVLRLAREDLLVFMEEAPALGIGLGQFLSLRVRALRDRLRSSP